MPIGGGKLAGANSNFVPQYGVTVSPSTINVTNANGAYTTVNVEAVVTASVGTLTYLWEQTGGLKDWTISAPDEAITTFSVSGQNQDIDGQFTCTVSDAGQLGAEVSDSCDVLVIFGNPR